MVVNRYIEQVASDLATIRRAMESVETGNDPVSKESAYKVSILIHRVALFASIFLLSVELATGNLLTKAILNSGNSGNLRIDGLTNIASSLFAACVFIYVIISKITNESNLESNSFIERHFSYLVNYNFVKDLVIKFIIVSFIIISKRPDWLGPVFSVFIADYLLQGRFFVLPKTASLVSGVACLLIGISSFAYDLYQLGIPTLLFSLVTAASLITLHKEARTHGEIA